MADEGEGKKDILALSALADVMHHERTLRARRQAVGDEPHMQQP